MSKDQNAKDGSISLPDGRNLAYSIVGEGKPAFYFHGLVESRLGASYFKEVACSYGFQVIGVDRPGFGLSTFKPNRKVGDFALDVRFLADRLGIGKFAVVGYSGGGPYAIACAGILVERVAKAIVISGPSLPIDLSGMSPLSEQFWRDSANPVIGLRLFKMDRDQVLEMAKDVNAFLKSEAGKQMLEMSPDADRKLWTDPSLRLFRDRFVRSCAEGYRQESISIRAGIQEANLVRGEWDVDLSRIKPGIVIVWHGATDMNVPVSNAHKNAEAIPGAHLEIFEGEGHVSILPNKLKKLGKILGL